MDPISLVLTLKTALEGDHKDHLVNLLAAHPYLRPAVYSYHAYKTYCQIHDTKAWFEKTLAYVSGTVQEEQKEEMIDVIEEDDGVYIKITKDEECLSLKETIYIHH